MGRAFTPGLQVSPKTLVRRVRELPVSGEVLVQTGDIVKGDDIVAQAALQGDLLLLRVAERLGIEPFEVIEGLQIKEGDKVEAEQLLCEHAGLFGLLKTRYRAPQQGVIELVSERTGHLGLRLPPTVLELPAYISGKVMEVEPSKSVTIETQASFVQGIFGVGGERSGFLNLLPVSPAKELQESDIPQEAKGALFVGGARPSLDALYAAERSGAVGLVCGSIDDAVLGQYLGYDIGLALTGDEDIPLTVIITEGFGFLPLAERVCSALEGLEGAPASLNGATQVRAGAVRPELLVTHAEDSPDAQNASEKEMGLHVGAQVRIIRFPFFGTVGEVIELPSQLEKIDTGARMRVLRARLETGEVVTVPRANVELI